MKQLDKYQKRKETQEETWIMNTIKLLNMQRFGEEFIAQPFWMSFVIIQDSIFLAVSTGG